MIAYERDNGHASVATASGPDAPLDSSWIDRLGTWRSDPFHRFPERRFFLGQPTSLVRADGAEGYDPVAPLLAGPPERALFLSRAAIITFPGKDRRAVVGPALAHEPTAHRRAAESKPAARSWWPLDVAKRLRPDSSPTEADDAAPATPSSAVPTPAGEHTDVHVVVHFRTRSRVRRVARVMVITVGAAALVLATTAAAILL